ncbi:MAG: N-acetylmuramoyl-L-alanine amidase [Erysipelotrichaceae bacterium]
MKKQPIINILKIIIALFALVLIFLGYNHYNNLATSAIKQLYNTDLLNGINVVVDAGHGGMDGGARAGDIQEADLNLSIAKYISEGLKGMGAKVTLTRSDNSDLAGNTTGRRKKEDMLKRINIINSEPIDLFISVHMNAYSNSGVSGSQIFYQKNNVESEKLGKLIDENIKKVTNSKLLIKKGDYYILNKSKKTGVLIECGFISNAKDKKKLVDDNYRKELAEGINNGIVAYIKELRII